MNVLYILSDQHNPFFCSPYRKGTDTPNLQELADKGTVFENMYTNCPLCVPSRASMITGRYPHEIGCWDNTTPYDGKVPGFGHRFLAHNVAMTTIGKLDFSPNHQTGLNDTRYAKLRGSLDVTSLYREEEVFPRGSFNFVQFDDQGNVKTAPPAADKEPEITEEAIRWLQDERPQDRPWILGVNFHRPHPKWSPKRELYEKYASREISLPGRYSLQYEQLDEIDQAMSIYSCGYEVDENRLKRCHATYQAVVEDLDHSIGKLLRALDELGIREDTLIIYTSDHGEMLRAHGIWGKVSMHEDSLRVPLIISGPGITSGQRVAHPVSLIDIYPTISEAVGLPAAEFHRGASLLSLARSGLDEKRDDYVFAESHGNGLITGAFAIRKGDWKLVEYAGRGTRLFNLKDDPEELNNLVQESGKLPSVSKRLQDLRSILYSICSPEGVDWLVKKNQFYLRQELAASDQLFRELVKRGYRPDRHRLVPLNP